MQKIHLFFFFFFFTNEKVADTELRKSKYFMFNNYILYFLYDYQVLELGIEVVTHSTAGKKPQSY